MPTHKHAAASLVNNSGPQNDGALWSGFEASLESSTKRSLGLFAALRFLIVAGHDDGNFSHHVAVAGHPRMPFCNAKRQASTPFFIDKYRGCESKNFLASSVKWDTGAPASGME